MGNKASEFDLVVIGSGPSGQRAAVQAAKLKKSVLLIEKDHLGGACTHYGTIPSKTLREAALRNQGFGRQILKEVFEHKDAVIDTQVRVIEDQMRRNNVELLFGAAEFVNKNSLKVKTLGGESIDIAFQKAVIAVGSRPRRVTEIPFDDSCIFDSDTILKMPKLVTRIAVLGAGVIGCEYASFFAALGLEVDLIDRRSSLLRNIDNEIVQTLENQFGKSGISLELGAKIDRIECVDNFAKIFVNGQEKIYPALLVCQGRIGNSDTLNLDALNLKLEKNGLLSVNQNYQSSVDHIYAVGDIVGFPALAASASEQGRMASCHAFSNDCAEFPSTFPYGIYTIPEISFVGKNEEELIEEKTPYVCGRARYGELARGQILKDEDGLLKLLLHKESQEILGVQIIGSSATELVHIGQMAMALGAKVEFLRDNIFNYPTLAEAYKVAAFDAINNSSSLNTSLE